MTFLQLSLVLFAVLAVVNAQGVTYTVGFENTVYSINEGAENVEVCVTLISPTGDIGAVTIPLEVNDGSIEGLTFNATADTVGLLGGYNGDEGCDYQPPIEGSGQIFDIPITNTRRTVCYDQTLCVDDEEVEGDEVFKLVIYTLDPDIVIASDRSTATIVIVDNDGIMTEPPPEPCPSLDDPENGAVNITDDVATYSCDPNHQLVGDAMRTCVDDEWSGDAPNCTLIQCDTLEDPEFGSVSIHETMIGSTADYSCEIGYELIGSATVTCQSDGTWSDSPPTCVEIQCPELPLPDNGALVYSGFSFSSTVLYICNEGYESSGPIERVCQLDSTWSGEAPTCEEIVCSPLSDPVNGAVSVPDASFGGVATYTCNTGYDLAGAVNRSCQIDGSWSGTPPICEEIPCPPLSNPANGDVAFSTSVGSVATYTCDMGYELSGSSVLVCQLGGMWNDIPPECNIIVQCPVLTDPDNGFVMMITGTSVGDTATYSCEDGYELIGTGIVSCQSNGNWSSPPPACIEFTYLVGFVSSQYSVEESERSLEICVELISPLGDIGSLEILLEVENLNVDSMAATADRIGVLGNYLNDEECDYKPPLEGFGQIVDTPINNSRRTVCYDQFLCPDDMRVEGDEFFSLRIYISLENTVEVNVRGAGTTIVRIIDNDLRMNCTDLASPENGNVESNGVTANYTCTLGYYVSGDEERTCDFSTEMWSGSDPVCQQFCTPLPSITDGSVNSGSNSREGDGAVYSCDPGFELIGEDERTCQADGTWTGSAPFCLEIVMCPILDSPLNGGVTFGQEVGNTTLYACDFGFYVNGDGLRVCMANGMWNGSDPTCLPFCLPLSAPLNGTVEIGGNMLGAVTTFSCDSGLDLVGSRSSVCQGDGMWSSPVPTCQQMDDVDRVNDTIIGDPLFTVTLPDLSGSMCYEVRGEAGEHFNLVSDTCISVNTLYDAVPGNAMLNRMKEIGIVAAKTVRGEDGCAEIKVNVDDCNATLNGVNIPRSDSIMDGDVHIRNFGKRWRVSVPNCQQLGVVMWITCNGNMLRFQIARGSGLARSSHGLLGQFWNIPISIVDDEKFVQLYTPEHENYRYIPAFKYELTWDHSKQTCYYVGNKQAGPVGSHDPIESVIEGTVPQYKTTSLFATEFEYAEFDETICN